MFKKLLIAVICLILASCAPASESQQYSISTQTQKALENDPSIIFQNTTTKVYLVEDKKNSNVCYLTERNYPNSSPSIFCMKK